MCEAGEKRKRLSWESQRRGVGLHPERWPCYGRRKIDCSYLLSSEISCCCRNSSDLSHVWFLDTSLVQFSVFNISKLTVVLETRVLDRIFQLSVCLLWHSDSAKDLVFVLDKQLSLIVQSCCWSGQLNYFLVLGYQSVNTKSTLSFCA